MNFALLPEQFEPMTAPRKPLRLSLPGNTNSAHVANIRAKLLKEQGSPVSARFFESFVALPGLR